MDHLWAGLGWIWDLVEATDKFGSIATALLALFVYFEAKRIRKIEWFSKSAENWTGFNNMVLSNGMDDRWGEILAGKVPLEKMSTRDLLILYSYLNVLVFEYKASSMGLLHRSYADKSINDNALQLRSLMPGLFGHLRRDGWPAEFIAHLERVHADLPEPVAPPDTGEGAGAQDAPAPAA